ncbi:hypothetical protein A2U01_0076558, partial [Trifolium medium]|nr:hypothetical protein [Trifolium medium]
TGYQISELRLLFTPKGTAALDSTKQWDK